MRYVKTANGIRNKILYGFIILACLLFFSGLISYLELSRLGRDTKKSMDAGIRNVELGTRMLDAVQEQNTAVLKLVYGDDYGAYNVIISERSVFQRHLEMLSSLSNGAVIDNISATAAVYNSFVDDLAADSLGMDRILWLDYIYKGGYNDLRAAVKSVIIRNQSEIDEETERFRSQAYRASMPNIITLAVSILIIAVFYMLIDLYYINPVLKITKGLGNYLNLKVPFNVKVEGCDEVCRLKEYINELITIIRRKEQQ